MELYPLHIKQLINLVPRSGKYCVERKFRRSTQQTCSSNKIKVKNKNSPSCSQPDRDGFLLSFHNKIKIRALLSEVQVAARNIVNTMYLHSRCHQVRPVCAPCDHFNNHDLAHAPSTPVCNTPERGPFQHNILHLCDMHVMPIHNKPSYLILQQDSGETHTWNSLPSQIGAMVNSFIKCTACICIFCPAICPTIFENSWLIMLDVTIEIFCL